MTSWRHFIPIYLLSIAPSASVEIKQSDLPPTIKQHPNEKVSFKQGESIVLPCFATGDPPPSYTWKKDDQLLLTNGTDITMATSGTGTIRISERVRSNEGTYQCIATNNFGSAFSVKSVVKKAVLDPFPSVTTPHVHRPRVGTALTLHCKPPLCYPKSVVYWGENKSGSSLAAIDSSERIALDYEGNLHFAHVTMEDAIQGVSYICIVQNTELRSFVQGDDQKIIPQPVSGTPASVRPQLMWPRGSIREVALKGQTKKMKCIFSGYPTPSVNWTRVGAPFPEKVTHNSYGREITIPDVDYSDVGTYVCTAKNSAGVETRSVTLSVESPPYWKNDKQPEDVNPPEEDSVRFECQALGQPRPEIAWFFNGIPVKDMPPDSRRIVTRDSIYFQNVTKSDSKVIQCNASNVHGYIFANAFLSVYAEKPTFIRAPEPVEKVAEGQNVKLKCQVFGGPKPVVVWKRGGTITTAQPVSGDRFILEPDGNLRILNSTKEDQGTYYCTARNKLGEEEASGELLVRSKTMIVGVPEPRTINASADITFHCNATTDSAEKTKLKIDWLKNGQRIDYEREGSISKNIVDNSLKITQAQVSDSGNYTCNASNGLDSHAVTVKLTVKGPPEPPQNVVVSVCGNTYADVTWTSSRDNNDPVNEYIVYYNTSFQPDKFHVGNTVHGARLTARVTLQPWTNCTFHVRARNNLGISERSNYSPAICVVPPAKPYRHPREVCTENGEPNQMIIVWEPMPTSEHNGDDFHYVVSYKRRNTPGAVEEKRIVSDGGQGRLVIENLEPFKEYEIYVQAENKLGFASSNNLEKKIGYSGQDTPLVRPTNFRINNQTLNSTSVEFLWDPVDTSHDKILGFFRGYQIQFWKSDDRDNPRVEDVILKSWDPCPVLGSARQGRSTSFSEKPVKAHTSQLWSYAQIRAGVLVLNGGRSGRLSDIIEFKTPEGVPSVVLNFRRVEKGSHHMKLAWDKPAESNGILLGYKIEYWKTPSDGDHQVKTIMIDDPEQLHKKIHPLQNGTQYRFYIYAKTGTGLGPVTYIEDFTLQSAAPSQPVIADLVVGENSVNVSWDPVANGNPGKMFIVEYKKEDSEDWTPTNTEDQHNWINVTDLEYGARYDFRVVAINNDKEETKSIIKSITVTTSGEATEKSSVASDGWFIGLMCAIAFLLLILLLICLIKRNRGGKYAVHEKEKLRGHDSTKEDDEAGFGEYTRTPHMELKYSEDLNKSRGSLESEEKPLDSESDSLGEYEDPDPSKFNEDGSFIGQYGGKKKSGERLDHDVTTPSALSTFV